MLHSKSKKKVKVKKEIMIATYNNTRFPKSESDKRKSDKMRERENYDPIVYLTCSLCLVFVIEKSVWLSIDLFIFFIVFKLILREIFEDWLSVLIDQLRWKSIVCKMQFWSIEEKMSEPGHCQVHLTCPHYQGSHQSHNTFQQRFHHLHIESNIDICHWYSA